MKCDICGKKIDDIGLAMVAWMAKWYRGNSRGTAQALVVSHKDLPGDWCEDLKIGDRFSARCAHAISGSHIGVTWQGTCLYTFEKSFMWGGSLMTEELQWMSDRDRVDAMLDGYEWADNCRRKLYGIYRSRCKQDGIETEKSRSVGSKRVGLVRWLMKKGVDLDEARIIAARKHPIP